MLSYVPLLSLFMILMLILMAGILIHRLIKLNNESNQRILFLMDRQTYLKDQTIRDLQNKLMSPDTRTYQILASTAQQMTPENLISSDFISRSDSAEAARIALMQGAGEEIYDEEYQDHLLDLGIRDA